MLYLLLFIPPLILVALGQMWVKRAFAVILLGVAEYYLVQMGTLLT